MFFDGRSVGTELLHHQIIDQQNVGIYIFWWQTFFNNSFYIALHGAAITFLIWTSSIFFFFRPFYLSSRFFSVLTIESPASIHWLIGLTNLFASFWLFVSWAFWMLWMLVTVHNPCHVPHASRITTWRTIFKERLFSVPKEWVRSWSRAFLIAYHKTLTKMLFAVRPEKVTRRKKRKKNRKAIAKLFALNANAKSCFKVF